jgi:hypothetical protein
MQTIFTNKETDSKKGKLFIHTKTGTKYFSSTTRTSAIGLAERTTGLICAMWNGERLPVCAAIK